MVRSEAIAYLGLGSNMGNREANIEAALRAIDSLPQTRILQRSPLYGSRAWGKSDQPDYLNLVAEISTGLDPVTLLGYCKEIERAQGRVADERWGPRPIDVDILLYNSLQLETPELTIPHPRMWERAFVLRPLADLMPDATTPAGEPIQKALEEKDIASQGVWAWEARKPKDEKE